MRPEQNGHHFADGIFKCIFLKETCLFGLKFHWNLSPMVYLSICQLWFRWWLGANQATSQYLNQWWLMKYYSALMSSLLGCPTINQTQEGLNKMVTMLQVAFSNTFSWKCVCLDQNFTEFCSWESHWGWVSIGLGNGFVPAIRQQAITSTSPEQMYWHMYLSPAINELIKLNV